MIPNVCAKVLDVKAESGYQDAVYEQTVEIEVNSTVLKLFDGGVIAKKDIVGDIVDLTVSAYPRSEGVELVTEPIEGIREPEEKISKWSYDFCGRIVTTDVEDVWFREPYENLFIFDVGVGSVLLPLDGVTGIDTDELQQGDFLRVAASRTDLVDIS